MIGLGRRSGLGRMKMNSNPERVEYFRAKSLTTIPKPIFVSLLLYIGTLAAMQTVYGLELMTLRWVALGSLTFISFVYWLLGRIPQKGRMEYRRDPVMVFIYLGATLLSVATAENFEFSGLRWMTQGMLILSCMVFLRGTFNPERMGNILLPLKIISLTLLGVSILFPAPPTVYENPYFRGAMGDSNSFGHISAICALIYLQGSIKSRNRKWQILQIVAAAFAIIMLIRSGGRSSMVAFLVGLVLINYYFGLTRSLLAKSGVFIMAALILASPMLQSRAIEFITKERNRDNSPSQITGIEGYIKAGLLPAGVFATRERLWIEAWQGFVQRPFLGWGFGANADIPKEWSIGPTSFGLRGGDITNDVLFTLEGSGLVGFLAYLALMFSILRRSPTRQQILMARRRFRGETRLDLLPLTDHNSTSKRPTLSRQKPDLSLSDEDNNISENIEISIYYAHSQMYILCVSLFSLFFFDGSAFSAGSLFSALFWISAGAASLTKTEPVASERINHRVMKGFKGSSGQGFE